MDIKIVPILWKGKEDEAVVNYGPFGFLESQQKIGGYVRFPDSQCFWFIMDCSGKKKCQEWVVYPILRVGRPPLPRPNFEKPVGSIDSIDGKYRTRIKGKDLTHEEFIVLIYMLTQQ